MAPRQRHEEEAVSAANEKIPFSERRALRMDEATQYSGLGKTSIYDAIRAGQIEATKVGRRRLIFRESLDRFLTGSVR
jgi:excisionase family DNA binding protein